MEEREEGLEGLAEAKKLLLRHNEMLDGKGGRKRVVAARAIRVLRMLRRRGFTASVVGSLATGQFGFLSDVDFLVDEPPGDQIWKTESEAMDIMGDIEFDLSYREEVRDSVLAGMDQCRLNDRELLRAIKSLWK